jgi:mannose-6-phosphate isomerase
MEIVLNKPINELFESIKNELAEKELEIETIDQSRPWGGFFVIKEKCTPQFLNHFFPEIERSTLGQFSKLSPKILLVAPNKRLSWQYHFRRAELWKLIAGEASVAISETDEENPAISLETGKVLSLEKGIRHRLIGTDNWGVVAEIWKHTDSKNPSDESDIVRLQDDFGR